jgi:glycosyltransferase involved in cell wall biosynthesis
VRILLWHGWLLEGSGSNVVTARLGEALARGGHEVMILCQESDPSRYGFIGAEGTVDAEGVSGLRMLPRTPSPPGVPPAALLRPSIGSILPVFVVDEYPGFEVKRFVDLTKVELEDYLRRNVEALRAAIAWHRTDLIVAGHVVPGAVVARRALSDGDGPGYDRSPPFLAKVYGSDLEYAVRVQHRYLRLAAEGLAAARCVIGSTQEVLDRAAELVPSIRGRTMPVPPGVDTGRFHPRPRAEAFLEAAAALDLDPDVSRGRPSDVDGERDEALEREDEDTLNGLAGRYDQAVPDRAAGATLRVLARQAGRLIGYFGKLIPQKGVDQLLQAVALLGRRDVHCLIVGFGTFREWLGALLAALDRGDPASAAWVAARGGFAMELSPEEIRAARGIGSRIHFTGRLDHRYAPQALAAMDVLVVPSVLAEAFGMVAAEGAAAGAVPLVARHSGLAEVAATLEAATKRPGMLSYAPGPGSVARLAAGLATLLDLPEDERARLRLDVARTAATTWTWERSAEALLSAAGVVSGTGSGGPARRTSRRPPG